MAHDRRQILIADDDSEVRLGAAELLDALGLVLQVGSGDEALDLVRSGRLVHLALLDLNMPGQGGFEVFGVLRDEYPDLPCILWSGDATEAGRPRRYLDEFVMLRRTLSNHPTFVPVVSSMRNGSPRPVVVELVT